jgi:adenine-specific DNA-methyltransferase
MIINKKYEEVKKYFNKLNEDKSHFFNSNDICTPMECVEEMVDSIPSSFWENNLIQILDPCAGNGNFYGYILQKFADKEKALKDNLYFNDISKKRISNIKNIFGENTNITEIDFLKYPDDKKFDLIVANPPFAKFTEKGERCAKNHNLSRDFIKKSIELTADDGYILFIIPDNWMSLSDRNDVVKILSNYQFRWINIHGAKKYFPKIGSSFTWFLLQKKENIEEFIIENNYKKINEIQVKLNKNSSFIPLYYDNLTKSIFEKTILNDTFEKFNVQTSSNLHKYTKASFLKVIRDDIFKYRIIHTPNQTVWSKKEHKFQNGWKVFISLTDKYKTFVDNCGMTQSIAFIQCNNEKEAEKIKEILKHPLYVFLNNVCRYGNFNNIRILQKFPKNITDDVFNDFEITKEEKELIYEFQ